ncbi:MAG TPA: DMT family transporter [Micromonosporaceae bacterium]
MITAAALVALAAAALYALSAALEHEAARREREHAAFDPRLLLRLVRRPRWLAGAGADLGGASLQGLALTLGPLALVQPILISSLIMALPIQALIARRRVRRHELTAVTIAGTGLASLILIVAPRPGINPAGRALAAAAAAVVTAVVVLVLVAWRKRGQVRAVLLGIATGALFGLGASLAKACLIRLGHDPLGLFASWEIYAFVVVEIAALTLNQNAFQAGRLAGSLTGITLLDPLVSTTIGVAVFQEVLALGGARTIATVIAALVTVWGIWLASSARSAAAR